MYFLLRKKVDFNKHKCPLKNRQYLHTQEANYSFFMHFFLIPAPAF